MSASFLISLSVTHFRGLTSGVFSLSKKTAFIGTNGSGKTHILEAIHLASGGNLHYFQAPRHGQSTIRLQVQTDFGAKDFSVERIDEKDRFAIQGTKVTSIKYREELPYRTVFVSPFDMNLLYYAPSIRRDYVDALLARVFAQFSRVKKDYETVMRQRNALLKKIRDQEARRSDLDFWDKSFAEKAVIYGLYREKYYSFVRENLSTMRRFLSKYEIEFFTESKMLTQYQTEESVLDYLREKRERDILTGHTHIGPHLEDFGFVVTPIPIQEARKSEKGMGVDATLLLSRGEIKMLLLALKQIEVLFLEKILHLPIVLLFDDLFAELDHRHAEQIGEIFDVSSIIITTQKPLPESEKWTDFICINLENL